MAPQVHGGVEIAVSLIHYALSGVILSYYVGASIFSACYLQSIVLKTRDQHVRRDVIFWLMVALVATYVVQAMSSLVEALSNTDLIHSQHKNVFIISSMVVWGVQVLALLESEFPVWYPYYGSWIIGFIGELTLMVLINVKIRSPKTPFDMIDITLDAVRVCLFVASFGIFRALRNRMESYDNIDEERQCLLRKKLNDCKPDCQDDSLNYGATKSKVDANSTDPDGDNDSIVNGDTDELEGVKEDEQRMLRRLKQDGSFWAYLRGFRIFLPHMLPLHSKSLQFRGVLVIFCLLAGNALNVLLPRQFGIIVDLLSGQSHQSIWVAATAYAGLLFLSQGCITWLRYWLWLPIEQFGQESLVVAAHTHVMNLSSDFHDGKESFEIHQAVAQGAHVTGIVETVCFEIFPMFVDLCLATAYLYCLFGPYLAIVVATTAISYIYTTSKLISLSNEKRRMLNALWRRQWDRGFRSIDQWVTASMFNNVEHEEVRYARSVSQRLEASWNYGLTYRFITVAQVFIMTAGLLVASYLAIYQVLYGSKTAGDFAALFMYWAQLRGPLVFFSKVYKELSDNMMDAERLLELLQTKPTVLDREDARILELTKCQVEFSDVCHTYDKRKPGLQDINFTIAGGTTVALVGETGSGKSTVMKLLNRFYDIDSGSILIDGQDIRDVTMRSLRAAIGVVPQDPAIFDGTIFNNVSYGRLGCTIREVHEACKAAAIHDKIMSMPDGYFTRVGRRGVKLSGGERQRLAIARTILKNPPIIILDEATSALDTDTEQSIQFALSKLSEGRSTFVVAHRLSTIINANQIMVLKDGRIIESGSHADLLAKKSQYHDLWSKQIAVKTAESENKESSTTPAIIVQNADVKNSDPPPNNGHRHGESCLSSKASTPFRPDAPEFFPKGILYAHENTDTSEASIKSATSEESRTSKRERKTANKAERGDRKAALKKANLKSSQQVDGTVDTISKASELVPQHVKGTRSQPSELSNDCKVQFRQPHKSNRRNNSKSEPPLTRLSINESTDHGSISEDTLTEHLDMVPQQYLPVGHNERRRVTAPSDSHAELPAHDLQARNARRMSHWRHRGDETSLGDSSENSSADDGVEYKSTAAPASSPAAGPVGSVGGVGLRSSRVV